MSARLYTPELVSQAKALAGQGKTSRQIAREMNISKTLAHRLVSVGKPRTFVSVQAKGYTDSDILGMYQDNRLSIYQIQNKVGVSRETIRALLHQYGIFQPIGGGKKTGYKAKDENPAQRITRRRKEIVMSNGYIAISQPGNPRAHKTGYVFEHILVWETVHNRPLPKGWVVHHLNGVKIDNRPENLIAMPSKEHMQYIPLLKKRIRELEIKVRLLERALEVGQTMMPIGEN